ncbi:hypothetical protein [uncultured Litoreibacter sp.]|uniref:hypothetical protein n=1 Tax=uncultured Litoreibacter sp. TaxID=1392394 RepID=UPI0026216196|nr:hypothetical protein [uncultured Litoreibacter sp.]
MLFFRFALLATLAFLPSKADAQTCSLNESQKRYICVSNPSSSGFPLGWRKACDKRCSRVSEGPRGSSAGPIGGSTNATDASFISFSSKGNPQWRSAYQQRKLQSKDAYTTFILNFQKLPPAATCQSVGFGNQFLRTLFGVTSSDEVVLTLMVSESPILSEDFKVQGYTIPLFKMKKIQGDNCQYERFVNDDLRIARLRGEDNNRLYVYVGFTGSEGKAVLKDIAQKAEAGVLTKVLNGTMKQAVTLISTTFGPNGITKSNTDVLGAETSLPLTPNGTNARSDSREFSIVFNGQTFLKFSIFQDPNISEEGELKGTNSLESAVREAKVADFDNATFTTKQSRLLDKTGSAGISIGLLTDSERPPSMNDMRRVCGQLKTLFANYGFSHKAQYLLLAHAMRKYPAPAEFGEFANRNVCLPEEELDDTNYRKIYLGRAGNAGNRHCPATSEWINSWGSLMQPTLRQQALARVSPVDPLSRQTSLGKAAAIETGEKTQLDTLKRVLGEVSAASGGECYYSIDGYGYNPRPIGSCEFLFYTKNGEKQGHWSHVEFWVPKNSPPKIGRATVGVLPTTYLDIGRVKNESCRAYMTPG